MNRSNTLAIAAAWLCSAMPARGAPVPHYDHIFLVMEENHSADEVLGNPAAPHFTSLAKTYALAINYFGVTHPSAGNYVALMGGSSFGIRDDDDYHGHTQDQPSLMSELDHAGLSWKGYFGGMPQAGFTDTCYQNCLYASKHNGIIYYKSVQDDPAALRRLVPLGDLDADLAGTPPNFALIVPDQCHDMHGKHGDCVGKPPEWLAAAADQTLDTLVGKITAAPFWSKGHNAVVALFDEGAKHNDEGCCGTSPGGGHTFAIVVTSHGPRGLRDETPYNHFSLLQTVQLAFGLPCLQETCKPAVGDMARLFAVQ